MRLSRHQTVAACVLAMLAILPISAQDSAATASTAGQDGQAAESAEQAEQAEQAAEPRADLSEANNLVRDGKYEDAAALLAELRQEHPDDPALLLMHGELLLALKQTPEARVALERVAELEPERPRVHFQLASALASQGDRKAALESFFREIALTEELDIKILAHLNRSLLFEQDRQWRDAAGELEAVLELDPDRMEVFGDLATLYLQAGSVDDAEGALVRGEEAGFYSGQHYYSLGAKMFQRENYDRAISLFSKALELSPGMAAAERSLAAALSKLDRTKEATAHLKKYLELAPNAPDASEVADLIQAAENR